MLMMIYNHINTKINKISIQFLHSWRRQIISLMTTMGYHNYIVSLGTYRLNIIKYIYSINRIRSYIFINRKFRLTIIKNCYCYIIYRLL